MAKSKNTNSTTSKTTSKTIKSTKSNNNNNDKPIEYSLGVDMKNTTTGQQIITVFDNKYFLSNGSLTGYDFEKILRNKQENIRLIYELMSYYVEADSLFGGAIKRVLTPFSCSGYQLQGSNEKIKQKYNDYYESVGMTDLINDIFYELYTYGNCYIYDRGDWFDIFPAWRIRISSIGVSGEPILEYQITEFSQVNSTMAKEDFINSVKERYRGYPSEVLEGIDKGYVWIQLDPTKTHAIQDVKSRYERYSIPFGVSALKAFQKKQLISLYEDAQLNLGQKGFLLVNVGDSNIVKTVSPTELTQVGKIFKDAINGFPLATVAWNVSAKWIETTNKLTFDKSKYASVNADILSSCGLASIIVSGDSEGGSFAQAQVNINTAQKRIESNQKKVSEFIKKINKQRAIDWRIHSSKVPDFIFNPINLTNDSKFKDEVIQLFQLGLLSRETVLDNMSFDFDQEKERKTNENSLNLDEIFKLPPSFNTQSSNDNKGGNPGKSDNERNSDKNKSDNAPKPSTT